MNTRAAVLGSPIAHSLSPVLHRAAYAALGLGWRYDAIECDEARLPSLLAQLDDSFVGLSLTMPLKRAVVPLLDDADPLVEAIGAANTVVFDGTGPTRRLHGYNTDVAGVVASVRGALHARAGSQGSAMVESLAVLGAGGTASAVIAAARELELGEVSVVVRNRGRAGDLLTAARRVGVGVRLVDWPGEAAVRAADLLVSTVPAGAADVVADASTSVLRPGQLVFDVLYEPWPTRLAAAAEKAGAVVIPGLDLLVQQAARQVELMTGRRAPVDVMRTAGERALAAR